MSYSTELSRELEDVGIRGKLRRRIVTEFEDHLELDPIADLGSPSEIARRFADELGSRRAIRAAGVSFAALAVAGIMAAVAFATSGAAGVSVSKLQARDEALGAVAGLITVLGAQVALAAGLLAALRAFSQRRQRALTRREATLIGRRAAVATCAGAATMVGMALFVAEWGQGVAGWWTTLVLSAAGLGGAALLAATPALMSATRLRPVADGPAGDLLDDVRPFVPRLATSSPWRFALWFAGALALAIALAGIAAGDPYDGGLRGLADGAACLGGFAVLGRYLGLR